MTIQDARISCGDLTARKAVFFIEIAGRFKSNVWIEKDVYRVNAKGILDVLSLKVLNNDEVRIIADGSDEEAAVEAIVDFVTLADWD